MKELRKFKHFFLENPPEEVSYDIFIEFLCMIKDQRPPLEGIWHPNGFLYVPLIEENMMAVRLHVWPPGREKTNDKTLNWFIHSHSWDLQSYVLCGNILKSIYEVSNSHAPTHRIYHAYSFGLQNELHATDSLVSCKLKSTEKISPGKTYTIKSDTFHTAPVNVNQLTATLVVWQKAKYGVSKVLGSLNGDKIYAMKRTACNSDETEYLIKLVEQNLCRAG